MAEVHLADILAGTRSRLHDECDYLRLTRLKHAMNKKKSRDLVREIKVSIRSSLKIEVTQPRDRHVVENTRKIHVLSSAQPCDSWRLNLGGCLVGSVALWGFISRYVTPPVGNLHVAAPANLYP